MSQETYMSIDVIGVEARSYLHSQLTCDVTGEFDYRKGLALEPDGKLIDILHLFQVEGGIKVVASSDSIDAIRQRLSRFLLRTKATIGEAKSVDLYLDDTFEISLLPSVDPSVEVDDVELLALRILNGDIARGHDYKEPLFPNALIDIDRYVSFTKGCYVGQEYVERTHSRGASAPKSLGIFSASKRVNGPLVLGETEVGVVLSGIDLRDAAIRGSLRDALIERYQGGSYIFFGLYGRKLGAGSQDSNDSTGELAKITANDDNGEVIEVAQLR
ncbi:MAG: hypothetical protein M0019_09010 [Actinomycetota bacterium]|nr:hypothetical protein [Actinomycetota bacterium]